jgi:hypothetical protein
MSSWFRVVTGIGAVLVVSACTPAVQGTSSCQLLSYYSDQAECQANIGTGTCELFTVNATDQPIVCWRKKTSGGTNNITTGTTTGGGGAGTPTPTPNPCLGAQVPWTIGAWTPSSCGAGVTKQTRTVSCTATCPCNVPSLAKPIEQQNCVPDLYGNKHYSAECTSAGGSVEWIGTSRICSFQTKVDTSKFPPTVTMCPSGWERLGGMPGYIITTPATAKEYISNSKTIDVSTGSHSSFMAYREYRLYCSDWSFWGGCRTWSTLYANIHKSACY